MSSERESGMVHNGYESCLGARYLQICSVYIQHTADQKGNLKFTSETKIVYESKGLRIRSQQFHRSNARKCHRLQSTLEASIFHLVCVPAAVMTDKPGQVIFKRSSAKNAQKCFRKCLFAIVITSHQCCLQQTWAGWWHRAINSRLSCRMTRSISVPFILTEEGIYQSVTQDMSYKTKTEQRFMQIWKYIFSYTGWKRWACN